MFTVIVVDGVQLIAPHLYKRIINMKFYSLFTEVRSRAERVQ